MIDFKNPSYLKLHEPPAAEAYPMVSMMLIDGETIFARQVRLLAPSLVARLNAECGEGTVTQVRVLGPGRPSWRKGHLHVPGRGPRDTYG